MGRQTARQSVLLLAGLLGENRWRTAALAVSSIISGLAEAGVLAVVAQVSTILATRSGHVDARFGPITIHTTLGGLLIAGGILVAARLALLAPTSYLSARIPADVQEQMRTRLFNAFTAAAWEVKAEDREGHLQDLFNNQINMAVWGAVQATLLVSYFFSFAALLVSALLLSPPAGGIVLAVAIAIFLGLRPLSRAGSASAGDLSLAQLTQAGSVSEAARAAAETEVFGVLSAQRAKLAVLIKRSSTLFFRTQLVAKLIPGLYQNLMYGLLVAGLATLYVFDQGGLAVLGAVVLILVRAGTYGNVMQAAYQVVKQSLPFVERVQAAEERYRHAASKPGWRPFRALESLSMHDVTFGYEPDRPVLSHVDFEALNGETIGIVGQSGAGKSTLAQLLLRLREPTSGAFVVNGRSAEELRSEDWTARVAYLSQTPNLIDASVADNIRYLRDLSTPAVERAARVARIHDEIMSWPDGYDSAAGPQGRAVSVGQAQRICLARALAGRPAILVLDEPTSALDPRSERLIQESLAYLKGTLTLFIITHRWPLLDVCDRVMMIDDGRLRGLEPLASSTAARAYFEA